MYNDTKQYSVFEDLIVLYLYLIKTENDERLIYHLFDLVFRFKSIIPKTKILLNIFKFTDKKKTEQKLNLKFLQFSISKLV